MCCILAFSTTRSDLPPLHPAASRTLHFRSIGLLWARYPTHDAEWPFHDCRPCCFICNTGYFRSPVIAIRVDVRTCGRLLVGVTPDACNGDTMVPGGYAPQTGP